MKSGCELREFNPFHSFKAVVGEFSKVKLA